MFSFWGCPVREDPKHCMCFCVEAWLLGAARSLFHARLPSPPVHAIPREARACPPSPTGEGGQVTVGRRHCPRVSLLFLHTSDTKPRFPTPLSPIPAAVAPQDGQRPILCPDTLPLAQGLLGAHQISWPLGVKPCCSQAGAYMGERTCGFGLLRSTRNPSVSLAQGPLIGVLVRAAAAVKPISPADQLYSGAVSPGAEGAHHPEEQGPHCRECPNPSPHQWHPPIGSAKYPPLLSRPHRPGTLSKLDTQTHPPTPSEAGVWASGPGVAQQMQ